MENNQVRLAIGGMIHDIGKILYRYNDGRNHSISGYDFLKDNGVDDYEILNQVKFHHSSLLRDADIALNSLAYITYWADNVSAGADRRDIDDTNYKNRFDKYVPLSSVFNLLNNNNQQYKYDIERIYDNGEINHPSEKSGIYSEDVYGRILSKVKEGLNQIELSECYVNSLLGVLEANLSFVPSSTDTTQYVDISLFDHMKVTAAIGSCMYEYLKAVGIDDYKRALFDQANEYYNKKAFLMFSMDTSGVQDFIYSVQSEGALKSLRSKSFYLEIMLEHIIDQFLGEIGVSRANLIYSGGVTGFHTKTVTSQILSKDKNCVEITSKIIDNTLGKKAKREHKHFMDKDLGVSPHVAKLTEFERDLVQFGPCKIEFHAI